jgi:hypothetical protein
MVLRALVRRFATCGHATLFLLTGCAAPPPVPPAADDATPPWMLRRIFTMRDGQTIELEGAPGLRAIATYLQLAMERHSVNRPEDLGTELRDIPDFCEFTLRDDRWFVRSWLPFGESRRPPDDEVEPCRWLIPELRDLSLPELAMAISDVVWKWPSPSVDQMMFLRPPYRVEFLGKLYAKKLREKLDRGMPLARAWKELMFQFDGPLSELTLLPDGMLRVMRGASSGYPGESWFGRY